MASMTLDPSEVQVFRNRLIQLASNLEAQLKRTDAAMEAVVTGGKYILVEQFNNEFIDERSHIQSFIDEIDEYERCLGMLYEEVVCHPPITVDDIRCGRDYTHSNNMISILLIAILTAVCLYVLNQLNLI